MFLFFACIFSSRINATAQRVTDVQREYNVWENAPFYSFCAHIFCVCVCVNIAKNAIKNTNRDDECYAWREFSVRVVPSRRGRDAQNIERSKNERLYFPPLFREHLIDQKCARTPSHQTTARDDKSFTKRTHFLSSRTRRTTVVSTPYRQKAFSCDFMHPLC